MVSLVSFLVKELVGERAIRKVYMDDLKPYVLRPERLAPSRLVTWDMAPYNLDGIEDREDMEDIFV